MGKLETFYYASIAACVLALAIQVSVIQFPQQPKVCQDVWNYLNATVGFWGVVLLPLLPYIIVRAYIFFCVPYVYFKSLANCDARPKNLKKRLQNSGNVPPPYPTGWFYICHSSELKEGQVKAVSFFDREYALYRGEDGKARIMTAFCPHLGANLAIGGVVRDNCLTCPFHGWAFDGEGKCVDIPYSKNIPATAHTETVPIAERNEVIYLWYDDENQAPTWEVPQAKGLNSWWFRYDGHSAHEISAHIQEIPENGADVAHLAVLHSWPVIELLGYLGFTHGWTATWEPGVGKDKHIADIQLYQFFQFFGRKIPGTTLDVKISQIGPGIVILHFDSMIGQAYIVQSVTPIEPLLQHTVHSVYFPWYVPRVLGKGLLASLVIQVERDIPVWNNKTYVPKPTLCKGDGKINVFRRWYKQFYNPKALEKAKSMKSILDW